MCDQLLFTFFTVNVLYSSNTLFLPKNKSQNIRNKKCSLDKPVVTSSDVQWVTGN